MTIILIAGLWLDGTVWHAVARDLEERGHRAVPLTLPGQGDGALDATLADQVAAVVAAVDAADGDAIVVGHSAASALAWIAADARPDKVAATVLIGGVPTPDGQAYADFFPASGGAVPFPGWEPFDGPDIEDLDEQMRADLAARTVPVPEAVTKGIVSLSDERRYQIPVVLICPEFSPEDARAWIDGGDVPELAKAEKLTLVDLDSGHWPMVSKPADLAALLAQIAQEIRT